MSCTQCTINSQLAQALDRGQDAKTVRYFRKRTSLEYGMSSLRFHRYHQTERPPKDWKRSGHSFLSASKNGLLAATKANVAAKTTMDMAKLTRSNVLGNRPPERQSRGGYLQAQLAGGPG